MANEMIRDVMYPTETGYTIKKVRGKLLRQQIEEFDDAFPDGVFAFPPSPDEPRIKIRALGEYCKEKGCLPTDLSKEEMEQFLEY